MAGFISSCSSGELLGIQFLVADEGERAVQRMPGCEHYFVDCRSISVDMFSKTMDLDLRWHLMRKTGEVTRIMDRGTSAIQNVLSTGDTCPSLKHACIAEAFYKVTKGDTGCA